MKKITMILAVLVAICLTACSQANKQKENKVPKKSVGGLFLRIGSDESRC